MKLPHPVVSQNIALAPLTSFKTGGNAEYFTEINSSDQLVEFLENNKITPIWLLGYGSNTLISDAGLAGITICLRGGEISFEGSTVVVDSGTWWDEVVLRSIENGLWGIELLTKVPGSTGAAIFINITAYGQSIGDVAEWVEVWDPAESRVLRINKKELSWGYKKSIFQQPENSRWIILRAKLRLSNQPTHELLYQKAIDVAEELKLDKDSLENRRTIITEARRRAGSLWSPDDTEAARTAGSFFRNPKVTVQQAENITSQDESGKTQSEVKKMNQVHGGSETRVSAAHVLLAAGFKRGQSWGHVKLNDQNLLKIEALEGASSQDIYQVSQEIIQTCWDKLAVKLEPEARILGKF